MFDNNIPIKLKVHFAQHISNLFIEELFLVPCLPVVASLAVLHAIDIVALLHVSTTLTKYHKSAIYVSYFEFYSHLYFGCSVHDPVNILKLNPLSAGREQGGRACQLIVLESGVIIL